MLTVHDLQFHVAWPRQRRTAHDLVRQFGMEAFSAEQLAALGDHYLDFVHGRDGDFALWRALECLEEAAQRGSRAAQASLEWLAKAA